jgi:hypothetical protein
MGLNDQDLAPEVNSPLMTLPSTPNTHNSASSANSSISSSNCSSNTNSGNSSKLSSPTQEMPEGPVTVNTSCCDPNPPHQTSFNNSDTDMSECDKLNEHGNPDSKSTAPSEKEEENPGIKIRPEDDDDEVVNMTQSGDLASESERGNCSVGRATENHATYNYDVLEEGDNQCVPGISGGCCGIRGRDKEKKKSFGFPFTKLNLRVFSRSSRSSERLEVEEAANNSVLMNNQKLGPPVTVATSVSKSSSESNIPMCHNSLDNLANDLPSSRSTDSSCLLPDPNDNLLSNNVNLPSTSSGLGRGQIFSGLNDDECVPSTSSGNNGASSSSSINFTSGPSSFGQKFKLVLEGDVQVCKVKHGNNLMDKFIGSKLLR